MNVIRVVVVGLIYIFPGAVVGEDLSKIHSMKFSVSSKLIKLNRLSDSGAKDIVASKKVALVNSGRGMWLFYMENRKLEKVNFTSVPKDVNWFGPVCTDGSSFFISTQNYPEDQKDKESTSSRGSFRAGPKAMGFVFISDNAEDRYISTLKIASRPQIGISNNPQDLLFIDFVQSCAWSGKYIYLGNYGSLAKADFQNRSITIIDEDDGLSFSRSPLLLERNGLWFGKDEGGLGGAVLVNRPFNGKSKHFSIDNGEDVVSFYSLIRMNGLMMVGTSHGLFQLSEKSGRFTKLDFDQDFSNQPVTALKNYKGYLWVFISGEWLRVDLETKKAKQYVNLNRSKLSTGIFLNNAWLVTGPEGIWESNM